MLHALLAISVQIPIGFLTGSWRMSAVAASMFFIGREITQAEYRWIAEFGSGRRANMPWWGGFDPAAWTPKSVLDVVLPIVATALVATLALAIRRR